VVCAKNWTPRPGEDARRTLRDRLQKALKERLQKA
jgi:hypothetical protein